MTTRCQLQHSEKSTTSESPTLVSRPQSDQQQRHSAIFSIEKSSRRNEAGPPATTIKNVLPFRPLMNNSLTSTTTTSSRKISGLPLTSYQGKFRSISFIRWRVPFDQHLLSFSFDVFFNDMAAKKLEMSRDSKISSSPPSMVTSGALKLLPAPTPKQRDAVSCWLDFVAGTDPTGNPVETYLRVGQEATVVVRVRQTGKLMCYT